MAARRTKRTSRKGRPASRKSRPDRRRGAVIRSRSRAYNVRLDGKWIDKVFQDSPWPNKTEREADVKRGLVNHDGYDPGIKVTETK